MAPVVAREADVARKAVLTREAGASPVTAREAVVAREDPVASTAAPVALMRPRGSGGVGAALVAPRASTSAGDGGEVGRRRIGDTAAKSGGEGFGGEVVAGWRENRWLSET